MTILAMSPSSAALSYALALLDDGTLSIDAYGNVWRNFVRDRWGNRKAIAPRRAESPTHKGYLGIVLGMPGTRTTCKVFAHVLIWTRLHGPIPVGLQVNHKDLKKANNKPDNLELMTGAENIRHSYANGRTRPWSQVSGWPTGHDWRPGRPLFTKEQRARVIELRNEGLSYSRIKDVTNISQTHAARIVKGGG